MTKMMYVALALVVNGSAAMAQQQTSKSVPVAGVSRADFAGRVDQEFAAIDANKDGKVTFTEIEQFRQARLDERARQANAARFNQLDKDKNGYLSQQEFAALIGKPPRINAKPLVTRFDKNKDGLLTREEYRGGSLGDFERRDVNKDGMLAPDEARAQVPSK